MTDAAKPNLRVIVFHSGYGCDTGCCGHVVQLGDKESFAFDHPWGVHETRYWRGDDGDEFPEEIRAFVRELVTEEFGAEHVADIDWSECVVTNAC